MSKTVTTEYHKVAHFVEKEWNALKANFCQAGVDTVAEVCAATFQALTDADGEDEEEMAAILTTYGFLTAAGKAFVNSEEGVEVCTAMAYMYSPAFYPLVRFVTDLGGKLTNKDMEQCLANLCMGSITVIAATGGQAFSTIAAFTLGEVLCGISNPVEGCGDFINFDDPSGKPKAKPNMADPANHEPDGGTCAENGGTGCNQAPKITHISKPAIWLYPACASGTIDIETNQSTGEIYPQDRATGACLQGSNFALQALEYKDRNNRTKLINEARYVGNMPYEQQVKMRVYGVELAGKYKLCFRAMTNCNYTWLGPVDSRPPEAQTKWAWGERCLDAPHLFPKDLTLVSCGSGLPAPANEVWGSWPTPPDQGCTLPPDVPTPFAPVLPGAECPKELCPD